MEAIENLKNEFMSFLHTQVFAGYTVLHLVGAAFALFVAMQLWSKLRDGGRDELIQMKCPQCNKKMVSAQASRSCPNCNVPMRRLAD